MPSQTSEDDLAPHEGLSKWCSHCGDKKSLSEFHVDLSKDDGRVNQCKACRAELYSERNIAEIDPRIRRLEEDALVALDSMAAGGTNTPHANDLIESAMRANGGIDGFMRRIQANYYASAPGSQTRTKIDLALMAIIAKQEKDTGALNKMSLEDLKKQYMTIFSSMNRDPLVIDATPSSSSVESIPCQD